MTPSLSPSISEINTHLQEDGFLFLPAIQAEVLFSSYGLKDWKHFAASWDDLGLDRYMADGGCYRRRRYGVFSVANGDVTRKKHQPHYQSHDYNMLNGGVERWFSPITSETGQHPALQAVLKAAAHIADTATEAAHQPPSWHVEVHQFRIEAAPDTQGKPTPEGMHRDGVDWVFVLMVRRENIREGVTSIHALDQKMTLGSFTLATPMDTAIVDDHRVYHGVTAVEPENPDKPAWRDVLVVTLRHE